MIEEQFGTAARQYEEYLRQSFPETLSELPITFCIKCNHKPTPFRHYINPPAKLIKRLDRLEQTRGAQCLSLFLKYLLCCSVVHTIDNLKKEVNSKTLSENHLGLFFQWYQRIFEDLSKQPDDYYHHRNGDGYRQDLAIAGLRAIPIGGAWLIELIYHRRTKPGDRNATLDVKDAAQIDIYNSLHPQEVTAFVWEQVKKISPRSVKNAMKNGLKVLRAILGEYKLYVVIHTADRQRSKFTPKHMTQGYHYIAELLELRKNLAGVYRASWFLDPALKTMSPRLAFLWELPCNNGAELVYLGLNNEGKALEAAPARQQAYQQGDYLPRTFAYHWQRNDLIAWSNEESGNTKRSQS
jgi:hypothetical protein